MCTNVFCSNLLLLAAVLTEVNFIEFGADIGLALQQTLTESKSKKGFFCCMIFFGGGAVLSWMGGLYRLYDGFSVLHVCFLYEEAFGRKFFAVFTKGGQSLDLPPHLWKFV